MCGGVLTLGRFASVFVMVRMHNGTRLHQEWRKEGGFDWIYENPDLIERPKRGRSAVWADAYEGQIRNAA